jgi:hypothetical protein
VGWGCAGRGRGGTGLVRKALFGCQENLGEMRKEMGIVEIGNVNYFSAIFREEPCFSYFSWFKFPQQAISARLPS